MTDVSTSAMPFSFIRSAKAALLQSAIRLSSESRLLARIAHRVLLSQEARLIHLRNSGVAPATIYDIGAFQGHWAAAAGSIFRDAAIYCFEANDDNQPFLAHAGRPYVIAALSDTAGAKTFYKPRSGIATGASLYLEDTEAYRDAAAITVPTRTLDDQVRQNRWPAPDLMKLDVQGAELDVLAGGSACLGNCRFVIIETSITRYNVGAPLIDDIIDRMRDYQFAVRDVMECHYDRANALLQVDILFERKAS